MYAIRIVGPVFWSPSRFGWLTFAVALAATALVARSASAVEPARLVKDINTHTLVASSQPSGFVTVGNRTFFLASTPERGRELWVTDGTDAGTRLAVELEPGPAGREIDAFAQAGGTLYMTDHRLTGDDNSTVETVLWKSDGRQEGTAAVIHVPGVQPDTDERLVAAGDRILFPLTDVINNRLVIWSSDGTAEGTRQLHTSLRSFYGPDPELTALRHTVFFVSISDPPTGFDLMLTDGTPAGTRLVRGQLDGRLTQLTPVGFELYFLLDEGDGDRRALWKSDGTSQGTVMVHGGFHYPIQDLTPFGELCFFVGRAVGQPSGIWRSDGTAAGTHLLMEAPETARITAAGDRLYFATYDVDIAKTQLWSSDGTAEGTNMVFESMGIGYQPFASLADRLLFTFPIAGVPALWVSDGTPAGTHPVRSIWPHSSQRVGETEIFFSVQDPSLGSELWITDGTEQGTFLVKNIASDETQTPSSSIRELTRLGDEVFFVATDARGDDVPVDETAIELWKTDGTSSRTEKVTHLNEGRSRRYIGHLTPVGDRLFFAYGSALWVSDGTSEGTAALLPQGSTMYPDIRSLTPVGDLLYFVRNDLTLSLCRSDGTAAGTRCHLADGGRDYVAVGEQLFFVPFFVSGNKEELWVITDGEEARLVRDIHPERLSRGSQPHSLAAFGDIVMFFADDAVHGFELWRSDGTSDGTFLVADINPGRADSAPFRDQRMVAVGGVLYFPANDGVHGSELWRTDGTPAGTRLVEDVNPGPLGSGPLPVRAAGRLFNFAHDGTQFALRVFDERSGRSEVLQALSVPNSFTLPKDFADAAGFLIFTSCDDHGCEPWASDGTPMGTRRSADIAFGAASSFPGSYTPFDSQLLLAASDGVHGSELWSIPLGTPATCSGDCSGDRRVSIDELVVGVSIALGQESLESCGQLDRNTDARISIDELIAALNQALSGCAEL
jgi:ELWxxDGT repeat protein